MFFASRFDPGGGEDTSEPPGRTKRAAIGNNSERMSGTPTKPLVSLILPVRNEKAFIEPCLRSVMANDYPAARLEILVVDGMSDDGTREIVCRLAGEDPRIRMLDNARRIQAPAMNIGIRESKGEILIRADGHTEVAPDFVSQSVRVLLEHPDVWRAGGAMETVGRTYVGRAIAAAMTSAVGVGGTNWRVRMTEGYVSEVPFAACWRWVYDKVGLFDEELVRNEDDEFTQRVNAAGGKHYLCPAIRSVYYSRATLGRLARQYYQYGFWRIRTIQKHRRPAHLRQVIPSLFVLGWLALIVGAVLWRPLAFVLAACAGLYLLALIYGAVDAARRASPGVAPLVPVACAIMHFAHGLGSMHGIWSWVVLRGRFVAPPEFHKMSR